MMEVERQNDGRWHFALGPVERWVVGICAASLIGSIGYSAHAQAEKLQSMSDAYRDLAEQQAVTNTKLTAITATLADVPSMTRDMSRLEVQVNRNTEDIKELRRVKGLK